MGALEKASRCHVRRRGCLRGAASSGGRRCRRPKRPQHRQAEHTRPKPCVHDAEVCAGLAECAVGGAAEHEGGARLRLGEELLEELRVDA